MGEVIRLENIRVHVKAKDWKSAIRAAGEPLLQCGSIEELYIDNMIESVEKLGPYIVIMPKFALAHAAPGEGVIHSDISLATFSQDVRFHSTNDPVRIVMCLACRDKSSHMEKLQEIARKLMDETIVHALCDSATPQQIYDLLNS